MPNSTIRQSITSEGAFKAILAGEKKYPVDIALPTRN